MSRYGNWILPAVVAALAMTYLAAAMTPSEDPADGLNLAASPVCRLWIAVGSSRLTPWRTDLTIITGKQEYHDLTNLRVEHGFRVLRGGKKPLGHRMDAGRTH